MVPKVRSWPIYAHAYHMGQVSVLWYVQTKFNKWADIPPPSVMHGFLCHLKYFFIFCKYTYHFSKLYGILMKTRRVIWVSTRSIFIDPAVPVLPLASFRPWFEVHLDSANMQKVLAEIFSYLHELKNYTRATSTYNVKVLAFVSN